MSCEEAQKRCVDREDWLGSVVQCYPKLENLATPLGIVTEKNTKKELVMTLRNIELLSSCVSFSFTSRHFPTFLKCYKMGKT